MFSLSGPDGIIKPLPINCLELKHITEKSFLIEKSWNPSSKITTSCLSEIKENVSSMEDIFELQDMYDNKSKEKVLEEKLKKLGNNN